MKKLKEQLKQFEEYQKELDKDNLDWDTQIKRVKNDIKRNEH